MEANLGQQCLFGINDSPTIFHWNWKMGLIQGTLSIQKIWPWSFLHTVKKCHSHPYHRMFPSSLLIAWVVLLSLVVLKTVQIMQRWKNIRLSYTFSASCPFPFAQLFCFLRPLQGQQEGALARAPLHCDPTKYSWTEGAAIIDTRTLLFGYSV